MKHISYYLVNWGLPVYPIYRWGPVYRNNRFEGLLRDTDLSTLQTKELKDYDTVIKIKKAIEDQSDEDHSVILHHLSSENAANIRRSKSMRCTANILCTLALAAVSPVACACGPYTPDKAGEEEQIRTDTSIYSEADFGGCLVSFIMTLKAQDLIDYKHCLNDNSKLVAYLRDGGRNDYNRQPEGLDSG